MPFKHKDDKKIQAVSIWLTGASLPMVAAALKVPLDTLKYWRKQDWWDQMKVELQEEEGQELDGKLKKIVDKSLNIVEDRIENGDWILDSRTGEVRRVPVKLRDVHKVTMDMVDKRELIRTRPQRDKATEISQKETLLKLAQQFEEWSKKQFGKTEKVIEGEYNAVHEEREEGLQKGVQGIPWEAGADSQPSEAGSGEGRHGEEGISEEGGREGCGPQETPDQGREQLDLEFTSAAEERKQVSTPDL